MAERYIACSGANSSKSCSPRCSSRGSEPRQCSHSELVLQLWHEALNGSGFRPTSRIKILSQGSCFAAQLSRGHYSPPLILKSTRADMVRVQSLKMIVEDSEFCLSLCCLDGQFGCLLIFATSNVAGPGGTAVVWAN